MLAKIGAMRAVVCLVLVTLALSSPLMKDVETAGGHIPACETSPVRLIAERRVVEGKTAAAVVREVVHPVGLASKSACGISEFFFAASSEDERIFTSLEGFPSAESLICHVSFVLNTQSILDALFANLDMDHFGAAPVRVYGPAEEIAKLEGNEIFEGFPFSFHSVIE